MHEKLKMCFGFIRWYSVTHAAWTECVKFWYRAVEQPSYFATMW